MEQPDVAAPTSWDAVDALTEQPSVATASEPEGTVEPAAPAKADQPEGSEPAKPPRESGAEPNSDEPKSTTADAAPDKAEAEPAATAKPTEVKAEPFRFKAHGVEIPVPGAVETEDGWVAMPREALNKALLPLIVPDRRALEDKARQRGRQEAEAQLDTHASVVHANAIIAEIDKLQTPDQAYQWALDFVANRKLLEANAKVAALTAQDKRRNEEQHAATSEERVATLQRDLRSTLDGEVADLLGSAEFKELGLDASELTSDLWEIRNAIFTRVQEDMPEIGLRKGDAAIRRDVVKQHVSRLAAVVRKERARQTEVTTARTKNQEALAPTKETAKAPPAVSAQGSPAPAGRREPEPKTKDEWIDSLR